MKRYVALAIFLFLVSCPQAFASGNLARLNGLWQCDVEKTIAGFDEQFRQDINGDIAFYTDALKSFRLEFHAWTKTMAISVQDDYETGKFTVVSESESSITIKDFLDKEILFQFDGPDTLLLVDRITKYKVVIYFNRIR